MKYYRILNDLGYPNRWFLGGINFEGEWDFWEYLKPTVAKIPNKKLEIELREEGIPLDFTFADFDLPIINQKAANLLNEEYVQLIPLSIEQFKSSSQYYLVIFKKEIKCVDEEKSDFDKWEAGNEIRPDKAGQYKGFFKLKIDPDQIKNEEIFRLKNFNVAIIINEKLKERFENAGVTGIRYKEV